MRALALAVITSYLVIGSCIAAPGGSNAGPLSTTRAAPSMHDFDFLLGRWTVQHRRLKHRLAHSNEWETFSGTCESRSILGGQANIDENMIEAPAGTYRAATMRVFDPATKTWAIWWFDSRQPHELDPPVVGAFKDGLGTFFANDRFQGKPIRVRFIWSGITATSARWQQAFSEDGGATWETNWVMEFKRAS
jgi:hypothetical protein